MKNPVADCIVGDFQHVSSKEDDQFFVLMGDLFYDLMGCWVE